MSGYGHEDVVKIKKVQRLKKQYHKPFFIVIGITFAIMIFIIFDEEASLVVDDIVGFPISRYLGYIIAIPLLIVQFKPTWFRVGDVFYFKTILTDKWNYDQYNTAIGWRKWF